MKSGITGPLGVFHLPRLRQKVSLVARGKQADGYKGPGRCRDYMLIKAFGLDKDASSPSSPTAGPPTRSSKRGSPANRA